MRNRLYTTTGKKKFRPVSYVLPSFEPKAPDPITEWLVMPNPIAIRAGLKRILSSTPFVASHRSKRFLRYIVENSVENAHESLKEYAIAVAVFERDVSYDPSVDATVRVEAGRLRSRLRDYYAGEGRRDTLVINVPKGAYRATFVERPLLEKSPMPGAHSLLLSG